MLIVLSILNFAFPKEVSKIQSCSLSFRVFKFLSHLILSWHTLLLSDIRHGLLACLDMLNIRHRGGSQVFVFERIVAIELTKRISIMHLKPRKF